MNKKFTKVLIVAPHNDDGEIDVGGFPQDIIVNEVKEATKKLGILPSNLLI